MKTYKAVLFSPDGEWVTDHRAESVEAVIDALNDQGSRWYFYPFHAVIVDHGGLTTSTQRLVDVAEPFENLKGRTIATMGKEIASIPEADLQAILS